MLHEALTQKQTKKTDNAYTSLLAFCIIPVALSLPVLLVSREEHALSTSVYTLKFMFCACEQTNSARTPVQELGRKRATTVLFHTMPCDAAQDCRRHGPEWAAAGGSGEVPPHPRCKG